jgi:hypothetical protein
MSDHAVYFIARDPLRYEPIRKDGEVRRFSKDGARAFVRRHLSKYGSLTTWSGDGPPPGKLVEIGGLVGVTHSETDSAGPEARAAYGERLREFLGEMVSHAS